MSSRLLKSLVFFGFFSLFFLTVWSFVKADGYDNPVGCETIRGCILMIIDGLKKIVVGFTVVVIIIAGLIYLFSGANVELNEKAKKTLIGATLGFAIVLGSDILINAVGCALGWVDAEECGGPHLIVTRTINFLFSIVGIIALIGIIVGGIMHMGSVGDESRAKSARKIVTASIIGLVIALLAGIIVNQIEKLII